MHPFSVRQELGAGPRIFLHFTESTVGRNKSLGYRLNRAAFMPDPNKYSHGESHLSLETYWSKALRAFCVALIAAKLRAPEPPQESVLVEVSGEDNWAKTLARLFGKTGFKTNPWVKALFGLKPGVLSWEAALSYSKEGGTPAIWYDWSLLPPSNIHIAVGPESGSPRKDAPRKASDFTWAENRGKLIELAEDIENQSWEAGLFQSTLRDEPKAQERPSGEGERRWLPALELAGNSPARLYSELKEVIQILDRARQSSSGPAGPGREKTPTLPAGPPLPTPGQGNVIRPEPRPLALYQHSIASNPLPIFVGRVEVIDEIQKKLLQTRDVGAAAFAIQGMPGVGKTQLARQLASRLMAATQGTADPILGKIEVDLWGHRKPKAGESEKDPREALGELWLRELKLAPLKQNADLASDQVSDGPQGDMAAEELRRAYLQYLQRNRYVVILDNALGVEHLRWLLPGDDEPSASVFIVTSRHELVDEHPLITEESSHRLGCLTDDELTKLVEIHPGAKGLHKYVPELMRATGGLALAVAIVLQTRKQHHLPAQKFLREIRNHALHLQGTEEDSDAQVASCFAFSTSKLTPEVRDRFHHLWIFASSFDAAAAESISPITGEPLAAGPFPTSLFLLELTGVNLIEQVSLEPARYRLHDLMQDYCRAQLQPEQWEEARRRYVEHYAGALAFLAERFRTGGEGLIAAARCFRDDMANFKRGMKIAWDVWSAEIAPAQKKPWAMLVIAYALVAGRLCDLAATAQLRQTWITQAIQACESSHPKQTIWRARLHVALALAFRHLNQVEKAIEQLRLAKELFRTSSGPTLLSGLRDVFGNLGNLFYDQAKGIRNLTYAQMENTELRSCWLFLLRGKQAQLQALRCSQQLATKLDPDLVPDRAHGQILGNLGVLEAELGKFADFRNSGSKARRYFANAKRYYEARLAEAERSSDLRGQANAYGGLGSLYGVQEDYESAIASHQRAHDLHERAKNIRGQAAAAGNLASSFYLRNVEGDLKKAHQWNEDSIRLFRESGDDSGEQRSHRNLAAVLRRRQKPLLEETPETHLTDRYGLLTDLTLSDFPLPVADALRRAAERCEHFHLSPFA